MFNPVLICVIISLVFVQQAILDNKSASFKSNLHKVTNSSAPEDEEPLFGSLVNEKVYSDSAVNVSHNGERSNLGIAVNKSITEDTPQISKELLDLVFPEDISLIKPEESEIKYTHSNYMQPNWSDLHSTVSRPKGSTIGTRANPKHVNNLIPKLINESLNQDIYKDSGETKKNTTQNHHNISNKNNRHRIHGFFNNKNKGQPTNNRAVGGDQSKLNVTISGLDDRASFDAGCAPGMARVLGNCMGEDK